MGRDRRPLYQSNTELSDTVVTYGNVYGFRGLSIRFCVIPMDSTSGIVQYLAFPTSVSKLKTILNEQNALGGQTVAMESAGVPCIRLPINELPGMTVALGVIEDPAANWGMGLVPPSLLLAQLPRAPRCRGVMTWGGRWSACPTSRTWLT